MKYLQVELLREMRYTWQQVADVLMISRSTLWRRLTELGFPMSSYSDISDSELMVLWSSSLQISLETGL